MNDLYGRAQHAVGNPTTKKVVLAYKKRQAEQALGSKTVISVPLLFLLQFLLLGSCTEHLYQLPWMMESQLSEEINRLLSRLLLFSVLSQQQQRN